MKKRLNKKAQFYLLAAMIISLALSGLVAINTYPIINTKEKTIQNMASELKDEGAIIVDYGIYNKEDLQDLFDRFSRNYSQYFLKKTNNATAILIYGNKTSLEAYQLSKQNIGVIYANIGGSSNWINTNPYINKTSINTNQLNNNIINVTVIGKTYEFELKDNYMFYFVIIEEKDGEKYVEKN